jgi:hypothetical protein
LFISTLTHKKSRLRILVPAILGCESAVCDGNEQLKPADVYSHFRTIKAQKAQSIHSMQAFRCFVLVAFFEFLTFRIAKLRSVIKRLFHCVVATATVKVYFRNIVAVLFSLCAAKLNIFLQIHKSILQNAIFLQLIANQLHINYPTISSEGNRQLIARSDETATYILTLLFLPFPRFFYLLNKCIRRFLIEHQNIGICIIRPTGFMVRIRQFIIWPRNARIFT